MPLTNTDNGAALVKHDRFGRLKARDLRDWKHALTKRNVLDLSGSPGAAWWHIWGPALDQGYTSECVSYSTTGYMLSHPHNLKPWVGPDQLYDLCQQVDEWAGIPHDGSSVRAAMKVLKAHAVIDEYSWAPDVETAAHWVLNSGPMVFGTLWSDDMMNPIGPEAFLMVGSGSLADAGGHAYLIFACDRTIRCPDGTAGAFRVCNSWGKEWGLDGHAWLPFSQARILLAEDGELACAHKQVT